MRYLSKLAYAEELKEATKPRPAAYSNVCEEQSTGSMNKLPTEVEFAKDIY
ncbi:MAG: palindromic element RPE1 domain-containing protein [Rickettsiaceae bacterium]|nr:palindromic element RPE1 domain-containing protein [Rickettsiaceae bacterium]MDD9337428.1 palindromic element RPE1 domain-containing protein [Rickettsiaceae bacterium]